MALRRSARAKRLTLRLSNASGAIILTMPARCSLASAVDFANRHVGWMEARLKKLPERTLFAQGAIIPVRGIAHRIEHRPKARKAVWVEAGAKDDGDAGLALCVCGEPAHIGRRIGDYLKAEAKRDLHAAVAHHAHKIGKQVKKITLRDTRSRWGSCSSRGSLNFSWRLIMAPAFVLDYLAAHEVAHLVHMDHSARFWKLAAELSPEWQKAEAWLKTHGARLHHFG